MYYPFFFNNTALPLIASAGNLYGGQNPPYTPATLYQMFPGFSGKIPEYVLNQFIAMADASVKQARFKTHWEYCMGLYIAHFATLYLITTGAATGDCQSATQVINDAKVRGLQTSKAVGDVSVSYDFSNIMAEGDGWIGWNQTEYGLLYYKFARSFNIGGMYVW